MPVNGLIAKWDKLHFSCSVDTSSSSLTMGSASCSGDVASLYTPDEIDVAIGVILTAFTSTSTGWQVSYDGPNAPSGGYVQSSASILSYVSIEAFFNNWRLYGTNDAKFHVFWDSIDIYVNGALQTSLGGGDQVSAALGPSWVPIFSGLVTVEGGAGISFDGEGVSSGIVGGGWRYLIGSNWYAPPVQVSNEADAPGGGPFGLSTSGVIVSSSTFGAHISSSRTVLSGTTQTATLGGNITLIPNLPKSISRLNSDFGASWYRFAIPQVYGSSGREYAANHSGPIYQSSSWQPLARGHSGFSEVGGTVSPLEDFCSVPSYSMTSVASFRSDGPTNPAQEGLNTTFPVHVDSTSDTNIAAYMDHADIRARYFNSAMVHPHWSIGYFTSPAPFAAWSGGQSWEGYWGPIREQYLQFSGKRTHIVSCPLESGGYSGAGAFLDAYFGGLRWIGVSRWQTQTQTPPANLTLDSTSANAWSVESSTCTLAFGSTITVTPIASVCKFDLDLARFDCQPFFYAQLAKSVFVNWPASNIISVKVYAVSSDGTTQTLLILNPGDTSTTANETYPMPFIQDAKYAGSWGIDNGAGAVTDFGTDVPAGGISSAVMGDTRRQMAFGMELGRQAAFLHFEVSVSSTSSTCQIDYPKFTAATQKSLVQENGQVADMLYWDGPGIRWSNHVWYAGVLQDPPIYSGLGYKPSVIDWLCDKRILLQAVDPLTGGSPNLTTECTQLYDSFEGQSVGQVDNSSIAFVLPQDPHTPGDPAWNVALVNTWSEVPPLAGYPNFDRDPANWAQTTALCQKVWAWCQTPRRIVSSGERVDLVSPGGTVQTSLSTLTAAGWSITEYSPVVTNLESVNWKIVTGGPSGTLWAHVTPWHGWFCLLGMPHGEAMPSNLATSEGYYHRVSIMSGDVWYRRADDPKLSSGWTIARQVTSVGDAQWPRITKDPRYRRVFINYNRFDGTNYTMWETYSDNDGSDWSAPLSIP